MEFVEAHWGDPDEGIWEVRGGPKQFTHSKLMAWVAADRAVKAVEKFHLAGPVERWKALREEIRRDILDHGYDEKRRTFTQFYGSSELDAALLMVPLVGFLPATDARVQGTVEAIEEHCCVTASSSGTPSRPVKTSTGCRPARARSWPARSGWPTTTR